MNIYIYIYIYTYIHIYIYIYIHRHLRERAGFTKAAFAGLRDIFEKHTTTSLMDEVGLRASMHWLGFAASLREAMDMITEVNASEEIEGGEEGVVATLGEHMSEEDRAEKAAAEKRAKLVSLPQFVQVVRSACEAEAVRVLAAMKAHDKDDSGAIDALRSAELPAVLMELGYTPPLPEVVKELLTSIGVMNREGGMPQLTFEDLCALMDKLRQCNGFSQAEIEDNIYVYIYIYICTCIGRAQTGTE